MGFFFKHIYMDPKNKNENKSNEFACDSNPKLFLVTLVSRRTMQLNSLM